jgi:hypothetical protein
LLFGRKETSLLFANDLTVQEENPKEPSDNLFEFINMFSNLAKSEKKDNPIKE